MPLTRDTMAPYSAPSRAAPPPLSIREPRPPSASRVCRSASRVCPPRAAFVDPRAASAPGEPRLSIHEPRPPPASRSCRSTSRVRRPRAAPVDPRAASAIREPRLSIREPRPPSTSRACGSTSRVRPRRAALVDPRAASAIREPRPPSTSRACRSTRRVRPPRAASVDPRATSASREPRPPAAGAIVVGMAPSFQLRASNLRATELAAARARGAYAHSSNARGGPHFFPLGFPLGLGADAEPLTAFFPLSVARVAALHSATTRPPRSPPSAPGSITPPRQAARSRWCLTSGSSARSLRPKARGRPRDWSSSEFGRQAVGPVPIRRAAPTTGPRRLGSSRGR
jgi:hypothetical protein